MTDKKLLFLVCLMGLLSSVFSASWKISSLERSINIIKGTYQTINFTVKRIDSAVETKGILTLKASSDFVMVEPFQLDTKEIINFSILIGVQCNKNPSNNGFIPFEITGISQDAIQIDPIPYIISSNNPQIIFPSKDLESLGPKSFGEFPISFINEKNIEQIIIDFTADPTNSNSRISSMTIPSYVKNRLLPSSIKYYYEGNYSNNLPKQKFNIKLTNTCYISQNNLYTLQYALIDSPLINIDDVMKKKIIKGSTIDYSNISTNPSTITINFSYMPKNVYLSCLIQDNKVFPSNDDFIRNPMNYQPTSRMKIVTILNNNNTKEKTFISFKSMSLFASAYYSKCIIDNLSSNQSDRSSESFTIGLFKEADVHKELMSNEIHYLPTQCSTWTFATGDMTIFKKELLSHCKGFLSLMKNDISLGEIIKGNCLQCEMPVIALTDPTTQAQLCMSPADDCNTMLKDDYENSFITMYKKYQETINTEQKIQNELSLNGYKLLSVSYENDKFPLDIIDIGTTIKDITPSKITLRTINTLSQTIECSVHKILSDISNISVDNYQIDQSLIINPGSENVKEYEMLFPNNPNVYNEKKIYSIFMMCYNLPGIQSRRSTTGLFGNLSFYHKQTANENLLDRQQEEIYNYHHTLDCSRAPGLPQCIVHNQSNLPIFKTIFNQLNSKIEIIQYDGFSQTMKETLITTKSNEIIALNDKVSLIIESLSFSQLAISCKCSRSFIYDDCRKIKLKEVNAVIDKVITSFPSSILKTTLTDVFTSSDKTVFKNNIDILFNFLITLGSLASCADGIDDIHFIKIVKYINEISKSDLANESGEQAIYETNQLLMIISSNLLDVLKYKHLELQPDIYGMIVNEGVKIHKETIESLLSLIRKSSVKDDQIILGNIIIAFQSTQKTLRQLQDFSFEESKVNYIDLDLDFKNITVSLPLKEIQSEFKVQTIQFMLYEVYPFLPGYGGYISNRVLNIEYYNDVGKQIIPEDLFEKHLRPKIKYTLPKYSDYNKCLYYNITEKALKINDIKTTKTKMKLTCRPSHLADFTIANAWTQEYGDEYKPQERPESYIPIVLLIILMGLVFSGMVVIAGFYRKTEVVTKALIKQPDSNQVEFLRNNTNGNIISNRMI